VTTDVIVAENLSKRFRRYHADRPSTFQEVLARGFRLPRHADHFWGLYDVSFRVAAGTTFGVIGANGSGKSTLLRLLGGVGKAERGSVTVRGRIAALLDLGAGFHSDLTGRENVMVAGVLSGMTRRQVLARFDSIVAFAEVEEFIDNPIRTYSSGMQMRLAFATAVHSEPEILLIDEVLSVGDQMFQNKCMERITQFRKSGCTIVLVSHDSETVTELCDRALWLHGGHVMSNGEATSVVAAYEARMEAIASPPSVVSPSQI
jgi:lipopolysaccharide transport system ATP-binding protein